MKFKNSKSIKKKKKKQEFMQKQIPVSQLNKIKGGIITVDIDTI